MLCVKHVHQDSSYFLACENHQKAEGHMLTANSGSLEADRSDRSGGHMSTANSGSLEADRSDRSVQL